VPDWIFSLDVGSGFGPLLAKLRGPVVDLGQPLTPRGRPGGRHLLLELGQAAMLFFGARRLAVGLRTQGPGLLGQLVVALPQGGLPPQALRLLVGAAGLVWIARLWSSRPGRPG
jgi:hypothetical protein